MPTVTIEPPSTTPTQTYSEAMPTAHAITITPLSALAREINEAHQEVRRHAKGMLLEARRAGDALLKAKKHFKSDKLFGQWRETVTNVSQKQAWRYMEVARRWSTQSRATGQELADVSITQFLDERRSKPGVPTAPQPFTKTDAEYAQKLHALATRGVGNEADVAKAKLDSFAQQFGMTGEQVVEKAEQVNPEPEPLSPIDKALQKFMEPFRKRPKDDLLNMLLFCFAKHPDLVDELKEQMR